MEPQRNYLLIGIIILVLVLLGVFGYFFWQTQVSPATKNNKVEEITIQEAIDTLTASKDETLVPTKEEQKTLDSLSASPAKPASADSSSQTSSSQQLTPEEKKALESLSAPSQ